MTIYEVKTSITTASGSVTTTSLRIPGGICRYLMIRANTSTTVFRANLQDEDSVRLVDWGFHTGELVETGISIPLNGIHRLQITNASPDDIFAVRMRVEE